MVHNAYVKIWGQVAGAVSWDEQAGLARFEYDPVFQRSGQDLAPLQMPLGQRGRVFSFPELRMERDAQYDTFKGLPGLLADSLPDRYGNQLMNVWLARNGRAADSMNPVEQLCFIGERGMGALEYEPTALPKARQTFQIELDSLVRIAREVLQERSRFETGLQPDEEAALVQVLKIGTSAGGARPKALIAYNEKTGAVRSGQTRAPKGFTQWLLKLDGVSDAQFGSSSGYGRVEMAYYRMACDAGIDMMESRLLEEHGRAHFMTQRFDREGHDTKHHIQTFCAMRHFDYNHVDRYSYEELFQTMRMLGLSYPEARQMYRRMAFNVMARNCDDHTKNFAFMLREGERWQLAPAYDICHAYRPDSMWVSQHALSVNGKRKDITRADLLALAEQMNIKRPEQLLDEVHAVVQHWPDYADAVGVEPRMRDAISESLVPV